ncbi:hypothetical protein TYRP_020496 [Tyrophagus putrescentiae]|nr:hypothetical protein TYRP_020496 [Tyrophagus putrescentiae]
MSPFAEGVEDQRAEDGHGEALRRETGKHTLRYSPTGRKGLSLIFRRKRFSPSTELLDVVAAVPGAKSGGPWLVLMLDIVLVLWYFRLATLAWAKYSLGLMRGASVPRGMLWRK